MGASLQRLVYVHEASSFDAAMVHAMLRGDDATKRALAPRIAAALSEGAGDGDRSLWDALEIEDERARAAELSEQLIDLDHRFLRWARVPRVCASIASSVGFLLATWAMRIALVDAPAMGDDRFNEAINSAVSSALGVVATGAAGTVACLAVFYEARRVMKTRREATEKLVERLSGLMTETVWAARIS